VTILAGAGCGGAHEELTPLAGALQSPVVHALRGKPFVEYDNSYDVGMTGLLGLSSGNRAMEHSDALAMLGTDFPYWQFYPPAGVPVVQIDLRGEHIGRRTRVDVPLVGSVKDTVAALSPGSPRKGTPGTGTRCGLIARGLGSGSSGRSLRLLRTRSLARDAVRRATETSPMRSCPPRTRRAVAVVRVGQLALRRCRVRRRHVSGRS
jgi:thiamine pyrophosphate-dependent acetolactate synthase large subunit-like protein